MAELHTINNALSTQDNAITLETKGTFVDRNILINNHVESGNFTNEPASGTSYSEETSASTIIPSGGALYLNKGWYGNIKIPLSHLIPDASGVVNAGVSEIRQGFEAFDPATGEQIIGTMPDVSPTFKGGDVTATASGSITTAPVVAWKAEGSGINATTYGITTTQPTGTGQADGTTYLTIDAVVDNNTTNGTKNGTVTANANATRTAVQYNETNIGYLNVAANTTASASATATQDSTSITVTATKQDNFAPRYIKIAGDPTFSGGDVTATATATIKTNPTATIAASGTLTQSAQQTNYGITTTTPSNVADYETIDGTLSVTTGSVQATANASRAAITYNQTQGIRTDVSIADVTNGLASKTAQSATDNVTTTVSTTDNFNTLYIPKATLSKTGTPTFNITDNGSYVSAQGNIKANTIGSFTSASSYGVTTTQPSSGTDGTDYLTVTGTGSIGTQGSVFAKFSASISDIKVKNTKGLIQENTNFTAYSANSIEGTSAEINVNPTITDGGTKYIPIVSASFSGGGVTATASGSVTTTPSVAVSSSGTFTTGTSYGVTSSKPTGTDGTEYLTITSKGTASNGAVQSVAKASRAAVTYTNAAGAIAAHSNSTALSSANATTKYASTTVTPTVNGTPTYYIPIVNPTLNGGTASTTVSGNATNATATIASTGTFKTATTYGVTSTKPTTGTDGTNYLTIDGTISTANGTVTPNATTSTTAVTFNDNFKGAISINKDTVAINESSFQTQGTAISVKVTKNDNFDPLYIPITTHSASLTWNTSTNATATGGLNVAGTTGVSTDGITTSAVSGSYITLTPIISSTTNGTARAVPTSSVSTAGAIKSGSVDGGEVTKSINVTSNNGTPYYIKVYEGTYSIS